MNKRDFIPEAENSFFEWSNVIMAFITDHGARIGLVDGSPAIMAFVDVAERHTLYTDAHEAAIDPAKATSAVIHERQRLRKEFETALRKFLKSYITYNPLVTDLDREQMGLPVHTEERHPAPVPVTFPVLKIEASAKTQFDVFYHDSEKAGKGKPAGVHGMELRWVVADEQPDSYEAFIHSTFDTRTPVVLKFDLKQQGFRVWLVARWENTRGDKGPWGEVASAIVS